MLNILCAVAGGVFTALFLSLSHLARGYESSLPGAIVTIVLLVVLARRTFGRLEKVMGEAQHQLQNQPPRLDAAIVTLERARPLGRWQIGVATQIDAQIGVIYFLQKQFARAQPHLLRARFFGHWMAGAMLAVCLYKKKDYPRMKETLEVVVKRAKKQALAWNLYAYLLVQINEGDKAIQVLQRGLKYAGSDVRINDGLLALQNGKKLKMRAFREQWYQFHLEKPPTQMLASPAGSNMRVGKLARRGRW